MNFTCQSRCTCKSHWGRAELESKLSSSLTFVRKLKTWEILGVVCSKHFKQFQWHLVGRKPLQTVPILLENSHYPLSPVNPLKEKPKTKQTNKQKPQITKKPQMWFVCHTHWLKNSFIVCREFPLSGNISYIKDHFEFSLGHSTVSKINSWKKVTKS